MSMLGKLATGAVRIPETIGKVALWPLRKGSKFLSGAGSEVAAGTAQRLGPAYQAGLETVGKAATTAASGARAATALEADALGAAAANYTGKGLGYVGSKVYNLGKGTANFMVSKKFLYPAAGVTAVAGGLAAVSAMTRSSGDSEEARALAAERAELAVANERLTAENQMREAVLQNATQQMAMAPAFGTPQMPHNMTGTQLATASMALDGGLNVAAPQQQAQL